jgi:DNA replication and repair protein RecF
MSLLIRKLELIEFRNYQRFVLEEPGSLVIITGDNAMGKTNIVEGLQLLTALESFRHPRWAEVVRQGACRAQASLDFSSEGRTLNTTMRVVEGKRRYSFNGKDAQRPTLVGLLPSVLFTPDDLQLIKGSSRQRRDMVDELGSQISPAFVTIRQDYNRTLYQKNQLLKGRGTDALVVESWNTNLAKLGAALYLHRRRLLERLMVEATRIYKKMAPAEKLTMNYRPSWQRIVDENDAGQKKAGEATLTEGLLTEPPLVTREEIQQHLEAALAAMATEERSQQRCLIGPHRDEIELLINGNDSRRFASQGQQRSLTLALRIASIAVLRETLKKQPLLLLDDVMSELDRSRRALLLEVLAKAGQVFITTTNLSYFPKEVIQRAQIIELKDGCDVCYPPPRAAGEN